MRISILSATALALSLPPVAIAQSWDPLAGVSFEGLKNSAMEKLSDPDALVDGIGEGLRGLGTKEEWTSAARSGQNFLRDPLSVGDTPEAMMKRASEAHSVVTGLQAILKSTMGSSPWTKMLGHLAEPLEKVAGLDDVAVEHLPKDLSMIRKGTTVVAVLLAHKGNTMLNIQDWKARGAILVVGGLMGYSIGDAYEKRVEAHIETLRNRVRNDMPEAEKDPQENFEEQRPNIELFVNSADTSGAVPIDQQIKALPIATQLAIIDMIDMGLNKFTVNMKLSAEERQSLWALNASLNDGICAATTVEDACYQRSIPEDKPGGTQPVTDRGASSGGAANQPRATFRWSDEVIAPADWTSSVWQLFSSNVSLAKIEIETTTSSDWIEAIQPYCNLEASCRISTDRFQSNLLKVGERGGFDLFTTTCREALANEDATVAACKFTIGEHGVLTAASDASATPIFRLFQGASTSEALDWLNHLH